MKMGNNEFKKKILIKNLSRFHIDVIIKSGIFDLDNILTLFRMGGGLANVGISP